MLFKNLTITMSRGGDIPVVLECPRSEPGNCTGVLTLHTAKKVLLRRAPRRKPKGVKLGSKAFKIAPGQAATVRIKLSKPLRAFLAKSKKLPVRGSALARDTNGNQKTTTRTLTVKAPRRPR